MKGDWKLENTIRIEIESRPANEKIARHIISAMLLDLNPTIEEICDIKTAVSEAVTNSIIHGYNNGKGTIYIVAKVSDDEISIEIKDFGKGIEDIERAREPLYTSQPELERSGMGFTVMESFMDFVDVISEKDYGTTVTMRKKICKNAG